MNTIYEADGMDKDPMGQTFSYSYSVWDGRVVRVSFFDHKGSNALTIFFPPAGGNQ